MILLFYDHPVFAGTPFSLCRSASRLCLIRLDYLAGAAAITPLVDAADEFVVDVHLLGLDTIWPDYLFMYHDPLNQLVEDVGRQFCNAGIFPDEGQELFDIFVDLITLRNLCCQLLPLSLEGGLLPFVIWSHGLIQAQDMGKVGAMQDLLRGVDKIMGRDKAAPVTTITSTAAAGATVESLLKRAEMFLDDGDWDSADEYCEKVLDITPENAQAYLYKLMVELAVSHIDELQDCAFPFNDRDNYHKVMRFGDDKLKEKLAAAIEHINARMENERKDATYEAARYKMRGEDASTYGEAIMSRSSTRTRLMPRRTGRWCCAATVSSMWRIPPPISACLR